MGDIDTAAIRATLPVTSGPSTKRTMALCDEVDRLRARLAEVEPVVAAGKAWVSALDSMAPNEGVHPYALALIDAIRAAARGEGDQPAEPCTACGTTANEHTGPSDGPCGEGYRD